MAGVRFVIFRRKVFVARAENFRVLGWILLLLVRSSAFADGTYQVTRDGKTLVWNDEPKPTDRATWSGDRDRNGYASGFGTLTWYTVKSDSGDEDSKQTIYTRYFGNMVRGKFAGPVNGHSKGVTAHALFSEGKRLSRWAPGPVPSWNGPRPQASPFPTEIPKAAAKSYEPSFNPPPPSYGIPSLERAAPDFGYSAEQSTIDVPEEGPFDATKTHRVTRSGATPKPKLEIDES